MIRFIDDLYESLQDDNEANAFVNAALEEFFIDHNKEMFLVCLKHVINARGGVTKVAKTADINRQHLYRMLSAKGNPSFENIVSLLMALGLRFIAVPLNKERAI